MSRNGPKRGQRERLVEAMIELAAQAGYQNVTIAQVGARAGVSTATFYELFGEKEACMVAAYRTVAERVFAQMRPIVVEQDGWAEAARVALLPLLGALRDDPDAGRLLFVEGLAGAERIREERARVVGEFERRVQAFLDSPPGDAPTLDVPATAVMGALRNVVSRHLRTHSEERLAALVGDGLAWLESYASSPGAERFSTSERALLAVTARSEPRPWVPAPLPRGRHRLRAGVVAHSQRERIIYGTAEVMMAKGYAKATVADIVAQARISRDVFYEHFRDKQDAFLAAQQYPTQYVLEVCAAAYFSTERWPERVWRFLRVMLGLIGKNPALSHLRLVECYAAGPAAIRRAEEITRSFTFFLEEGYVYRAANRSLPRLYSEAIAGAIFETLQRAVASGEFATVPRLLPALCYVAIAPFVGAGEAARMVEGLSGQEGESERGGEGSGVGRRGAA